MTGRERETGLERKCEGGCEEGGGGSGGEGIAKGLAVREGERDEEEPEFSEEPSFSLHLISSSVRGSTRDRSNIVPLRLQRLVKGVHGLGRLLLQHLSTPDLLVGLLVPEDLALSREQVHTHHGRHLVAAPGGTDFMG
eukprot:745721-Hanusia_phi.AAC.5